MFTDPNDPAAVTPAAPGAVPPRMTDAQNPAARTFALMRLRQLVRSGLLGGMPQNMTDPTLVWRGLSTGLGANPQALAQFQAAASPVPHDPAFGAHATAPAAPVGAAPAPVAPHDPSFDAHQTLASASPRVQLETMARAKAVARTMQHLRQIRPYQYGGRH